MATPQDLNKKILNQNKAFTDYLFELQDYTYGHEKFKPLLKKYFTWYSKGAWSRFINNWNDFISDVPRNKMNSKDYSSMRLWDISFRNLQAEAVSLLGLSPSTKLIVGAEMSESTISDSELQKFRTLCDVSIIVDENGKNPVLSVSANFKYPGSSELTEFRRSVALEPLVKMLGSYIRQYHDQLHAHDSTEVSGVMSRMFHKKHRKTRKETDSHDHRTERSKRTSFDASKAASRNSQPDEGREEENSGYLDSPENLPNPLGDDPMQAAFDYGNGINPYGTDPLPPGTDPLMVQGWYDSIVKTARHLAETKAVKNLYHDLKKAASNRQLQSIALSAVVGPAAPSILNAAYQAHDAIVAARNGDAEAISKLKSLKEASDSGNQAAAQTLETARHINEMIKAKEVSGGSQSQVSGWLYNRPYRSNTDVIVDAASGKFPTVGIMLREGWHDGLDFVKTMHRKSLSSILAH